MGREFELKYKATPEKLEAIRAQWSDWTLISMQTTYYDTAEEALAKKKYTLRCRLENGISVCTLKTPDGHHGRGEWELSAPWCEDTVRALFAAADWEAVAFSQLQAVCGARFTRQAREVALPGAKAEVALDQGVLIGANREVPLCEVEVEHKAGEEAATAQWAEKLALAQGIREEPDSKFRRALALAKGE